PVARIESARAARFQHEAAGLGIRFEIVTSRRSSEGEIQPIELALLNRHVARPNVHLRWALQARIEIDERLQSLQRDAGMLNAAAARGDVEHRILHRAVDDAARAQSAAALRREQAEILAVESEAQIEPLV